MMSFGALKYFESVIKKLKKIIVFYQPRDVHMCNGKYTFFTLCLTNFHEIYLTSLVSLPHLTVKLTSTYC